ncbi:MAG: T9SS type A sorting domain-containing protein, partial [Cyclobacteriaceae bacterium]|nr:T9SS type A sorting domain-containing protein [Cyclobacteriaceae bacterium]
GLSQKAHRFTVGKQGAGLPDGSYIYRDYVTVPFQVWDTDNHNQLMVSFRAQQEDGVYNLIEQNTEDGDEANHSREYLFIHKVNYAETPNEEIAQNGGENKGHTYNQLYFFWPVLQDGMKWDPENMPGDTITVDYEIVTIEKRFGEIQPVSDAYEEFLKLNPAYNSDDSEIEFHPDHHNLIMIPEDSVSKKFKVLNGNDGGVYISNIADVPGINDGDWTFSGNGFNSGQFYSATKKPGADQFIGGLQDNGTWISPSESVADAATSYILAIGGDGFDVLWNYADPDLILGGSQGNNFYRSDDGGNNWTSSTQGLDGVMPFFSKLASSNSHPDRVFTLSSLGVYRSNDFGQSWTLSPISQNWTFTDFMEIKVSIANPDIVWAGSGMSGVRAIHVSTDGGKSFSETNQFSQAELGILSGFSTHPENDSTAFALFSFAKGPKILLTTDLGASWEDISGFGSGNSSNNGFPDVAVYSLLVRPDNSDIIWAGTEIGIFESNDVGLSWTFLEGDIGSVAIWEMKVVDDQIVLATHGRGIYTATIPISEEVVIVPKIIGAGTSVQGDLSVLVQLRSLYDSTALFINNQRVEANAVHEIGDALFTVSGLSATGDSVNVSFISYRKGKKYEADPTKALLFDVKSPTVTYEQNFDVDVSGDFIGYGFSIMKLDGFDDEAIHSDHPYLEGNDFPGNRLDLVFQLKTPIIVSSRNFTIKYRDIAVVEPGEPKTLFPSSDFYDYVIVEGSKDGVVWQNFGKGYDAAKNGKWINAYEGSQAISKSLYINESANIHNLFQPNDTIFIRFRLYSDPFTTGWGWSIDNLAIQSIITDLEDQNSLVQNILIYPNPADEYFKIANIASSVYYELLLFNVNGVVVKNEIVSSNLSREIIVNVSDIRAGTYILKLKSSNQEFTSKVIIN